jgi:eukaryotic-like serine/threonine-protein kinase
MRAAAAVLVFEPGAVLAKRYRLDAAIASGGMGTVFRATHLALGHDVAVKVLHERALNDDALRRFAREARIAAHLSEVSRNIVRVVDYGVEQGRPFLVMELLRGQDLRQHLERKERLSAEDAVEIVAQLADALDVAHEEGVVHRDLKPANVFLARTRDELVVKLMDFGVAQSGEGTARGGFVLGTPSFMSPEQIEGRAVDARTDLWALGVITYRMLTGVMPFGAGTINEVGQAIMEGNAEPPTSIVPSLPAAIDDWMRIALAFDREERFQSAPELVSELRVALGLRTSGYPALTRSSSGMRRVSRDRGPMWLALAVAVAMVVSVLMLVR